MGIDIVETGDSKQMIVKNVASYLTKLIQEGDIIVSIQDELIQNRLEYELAMLKHSSRGQLELIIDRKGTHHRFLINPADRIGTKDDKKTVSP